MPDWPAVPLFCLLFLVACGRAGATYAIGRGVRGLADRRTRVLERPVVQRAERVVGRYGAPAVVLCFLTVGVQTAINAAAGGLRMPLARYLPALFAGALIWATIYLTVGMAVLEAVWGGQWLPLVVLAGAVAVGWLVHRWFVGQERSGS
ncbi:MAG: DedA family protein [Nocardioidaceae bacterium]